MKKQNPKPDDPGQSKRFKEISRKLGVDLDDPRLTETLRRVSGQEPNKKKKPADEHHR